MDWINIATATPPLNPMRLFDKISEATTDPPPEISAPPPPPAPQAVIDDTALEEEEKKKRKKFGRDQTLLTGDLGEVTTLKPTLLGQ